MKNLVSDARKQAMQEAKAREQGDAMEMSNILARYRTDKTCQTPNAPVNRSTPVYKKALDAEYAKIILIAQRSPEHFSKLMEEYINDTQFDKIQDSAEKKFLQRMELVKKKGNTTTFREGSVIKTIAMRTAKIAGGSTLGQLGVNAPKTGFFQSMRAFDPNERGTAQEDKLEVIDKKLFAKDSDYRADRIAEAKRYERMGLSATNSQRAMADWVKEKEANDKYARDPKSRMSTGERAMYSVGAGIFKGVGAIGTGLWGVGKKAAGAIGSAMVSKSVANEQVELNTPHNVPDVSSPQLSQSTKDFHELYGKHNSPTNRKAANDENETPSYVMSNADVESKDEEKDELEEKTYEYQEKSLSLLETIDKSINKIDIDTGLKGGIAAILPAGLLSGLASLAKFAAIAGALTLASRSITDWIGKKFGIGYDKEGNELEIDEKTDDANWDKMSGIEKLESGLARGIEYAGAVVSPSFARQAEFDRINLEKLHLDKKESGPAFVMSGEGELATFESTDNHDRVQALHDAKTAADNAAAEKTASLNAAKIAPVINTTQNTNVAPQKQSEARQSPNPFYYGNNESAFNYLYDVRKFGQ